jgi:4-hydroxybenzoate polyprenyltransferase
MESQVTPQEASAALNAVERGRLTVIDEIGLPRWYWWGLALGWVALGFVIDLKHAWLTAAATLLFGAVHASVAARATSGRRRTRRLSVRAEVAGGYRTARLVIACVAVLGALTVGLGWAASADGANHPVTIASMFVALTILLGRPQLVAAIRRRAAASTTR